MKYLKSYSILEKMKSSDIKRIAITMIVSSIDSRIGEGGAFAGYDEVDADAIKNEIDKICLYLESKIKSV